ncbi:hypothetical protein NDU88_005571 [Pleurodeles waltl]|uniref:Uncharacterized protein n=1 Tax=Pleurodeles waltl TaxID=8319 RepID=A0AAV7MYU6_PLEWA|nr:hypothetical protein NDU88_005571 [Pleurodeles waltl]
MPLWAVIFPLKTLGRGTRLLVLGSRRARRRGLGCGAARALIFSPGAGGALLKAWVPGSWSSGRGGRPSMLELAGGGRLLPPDWCASQKTEERPEIPVADGGGHCIATGSLRALQASK